MSNRPGKSARLFVAFLLALSVQGVARAQELYDTPIWADDLGNEDRLWINKAKHSAVGHVQEWAHDILAVRHVSGKDWSRLRSGQSGNANKAYVIYDTRVHAMSAGRVIACWRNAPENPRGKKTGDTNADYLHANVIDDRIALGGNFLWIEEDDGERILYGHAIPGTIPAALCPNNKTILDSAYASAENQMPSATVLPAGTGAQVQVGQFLMKVGNSGNSSEPHLHIHKLDSTGNATRINFRRGLSTGWGDDGAAVNDWSSFARSPYPAREILIWPPRRLGHEYARHGFPAADYGRWFSHLLDSGYQLSWLDTYMVAGKGFMNMVWHPGSAQWRASHLISEADYKAAISADERDKFDPILIETSLAGSGNRYSIISVKNKPGGWRARHMLTPPEYLEVRNKARADKLSPASVAVTSLGIIRYYTVLFNNDDIGDWRIEPEISEGEYQGVFDAQKAAGRHPIYLNSYMHAGKRYLSAIFAQKAGSSRIAGHGMSPAEFQTAYSQNAKGSRRTRTVTSYDGAQGHRYAAVWAVP